ncbi:diphthine--ammonia ligase [Candidatus Pacearchaeota archaeon]|nr:diphthine--ammonia ligase [Candidatus Pacearchaeota archaeon]
MKTGILFSGGKDSCLALHKYKKDKVNCLLSIIPEHEDSFMFHSPNTNLLKKQAEMLNLPLILQKTKGEKEKELEDLKKLIEKSGVDEIVIGGIKSSYQASRIQKICLELGVKVHAPLWNHSAERLWRELLKNNFKVIITKIASEGIPPSFLGKIIDREKLEKLRKLSEKYKFRLDFEGGDAETSVLFMPEFKKEIKIEFDVKSEGGFRHFLRLNKIL